MGKWQMDPRVLLEIPAVYTFFQWVVGASGARKRVLHSWAAVPPGARVLEIGCGPGTNLDHLPVGIRYVGCDADERYIRDARQRYGHRGEFVHAKVGELGGRDLGLFDYVFSIGLLHHLDAADLRAFCFEARDHLREGGTLIAMEPCFSKEQTPLERWIIARDRGVFIREPRDYAAALREAFPSVEERRYRGGNLTPHSGIFLRARKPAA